MLSASAHKFNGPKGIGFLYVKRDLPIISLLDGGSQERKYRAGTENVASIVGMAVALKKNCERLNENTKHILELEEMLLSMLKEEEIAFAQNGFGKRVPGNLSLAFPGFEGETLLHRLDLMGVQVSTGSACNSISTQISHVLQAIQADRANALGTIRISLGKDNTKEDIISIVTAINTITKRN